MSEPLRVLLHNDETSVLMAQLRAAHPDIIVEGCHTYDDLPAHIQAFDPDIVYTVRFAGSDNFPRSALFSDTGPRWIANGGAGTDHFGQWDSSRITVTNAAGVAADMMAEYVIGSFLYFTLDVPGLLADKARTVWNASRTVIPLKGKTLLILGLGHTGQAIAARAKAFGMTVFGTRARPQAMVNIDEVAAAGDFHRLLPQADFIAVSVPLTPETRGLIGCRAFAAMKPGVILADVSRGGVMDHDALLEALRTGTVAGAALDVFDTEPLDENSPLWTRPEVLLSPHCSSVYDGWSEASFDLFLRNVDRWKAGQELLNIVDPVRGY